jgi:CRISPR/Cas system-associated exonuclease Cas4 (RecB family)
VLTSIGRIVTGGAAHMALLPIAPPSPIRDAIWRAYEARGEQEAVRGHLGASIIGRLCRREIWYTFRWAGKQVFSGRMRRLFQTGHLEEPRIFDDLRAIGCTVHDVDPSTDRQFWYGEYGGHFSGSLDGVGVGVPTAEKTWHVIEAKTHSAKSYASLEEKGVQVAKPEHFAQMQTYMRWTELDRALYFAVCKDNDDLHIERIHYDERAARAIQTKAHQIIDAANPPDGNHTPLCDYCHFQGLCNGEKMPLVNCRTCQHAAPVTTGTGGHWTCGWDQSDIPFLLQQRGCRHHLFIAGLLPWAERVEAGDGFNVYSTQGRYFVNSTPEAFSAASAEHYTSEQLEVMAPERVAR